MVQNSALWGSGSEGTMRGVPVGCVGLLAFWDHTAEFKTAGSFKHGQTFLWLSQT